MNPEVIVDCACATGENPLWHPMEKRVYWVDIPVGRLFRHDPVSVRTESFDLGIATGGFTIQPDGALLLFMARGGVAVWREGTMQKLIKGIVDERENRFNDVIADPEGRVFCGTLSLPTRPGRLYRLDVDCRFARLLDDVGTSNGMGFTPDGKRMYHTDTRKHEIRMFDYDRATGAIINQRTFVKVSEGPSRPDGLTVDAEGCVWSARWEGSCLVRYSPEGKEMLRIEVPVKNVSSLTFGGPDYTDIYITTAGGNDRVVNGSSAGALFHMNLGIRGVPEFFSRIDA